MHIYSYVCIYTFVNKEDEMVKNRKPGMLLSMESKESDILRLNNNNNYKTTTIIKYSNDYKNYI